MAPSHLPPQPSPPKRHSPTHQRKRDASRPSPNKRTGRRRLGVFSLTGPEAAAAARERAQPKPTKSRKERQMKAALFGEKPKPKKKTPAHRPGPELAAFARWKRTGECPSAVPDNRPPSVGAAQWARFIRATKAMIQTRLIAEGIEPDPGPSTSDDPAAPSTSRKYSRGHVTGSRSPAAKAKEKGKKPQGALPTAKASGKLRAAINQVAEQVKAETEKKKGEADAIEEARVEIEEATINALASRLSQGAPLIPRDIWFRWDPEAVSHKRDKLLGVVETRIRECASLREDGLPLEVLPHKTTHAHLRTVVPSGPDSRCPQERRVELTSETLHLSEFTAIYDLSIQAYAFLGHPTGLPVEIQVRIPLDATVICHNAGLGEGCNFRLTYDLVDSRLARLKDVNADCYSQSKRQWVSALIAATLVVLEGEPFIPTAEQLLAWPAIYKALNVCERKLTRSHEHAEGYYLQGYNVDLLDLYTSREIAQTLRETPGAVFKYCAEKAPKPDRCRSWFRIRGLSGAFPTTADACTMAVGAFKRITARTKDIDPHAQATAMRVFGYIDQTTQPAADFNPEAALNYFFTADGPGTKYCTADREQCVGIAHMLSTSPNDLFNPASIYGKIVPLTGADLLEKIRELKAFVKSEIYDEDVKKPPRFIVSPSPPVRFLLYCLFAGVEHALLENPLIRRVSVKGLDEEERRRHISDVFANMEAAYFFEDDISSMECQVRGPYLEAENALLANHTPNALRQVARTVVCELEEFRLLHGGYFHIEAPPARSSGTYQTSIGNTVNNLVWKVCALASLDHDFAALSDPTVVSPQEFGGIIEMVTQNLFVEGDDALFAWPTDVSAHVCRAYESLGVPNKLKMERDWSRLTFCGNRLTAVDAPGGVRNFVMRNPLHVLNKIRVFWGSNRDTNVHDDRLMAARACSTLFSLGDYPVVGPFCHAVLRQCGYALKVAQTEIMSGRPWRELSAGTRAVFKEFHDLAMAQGQEVTKVATDRLKALDQMVGASDAVSRVPEILRAEVERLYGISRRAQHEMERQLNSVHSLAGADFDWRFLDQGRAQAEMVEEPRPSHRIAVATVAAHWGDAMARTAPAVMRKVAGLTLWAATWAMLTGLTLIYWTTAIIHGWIGLPMSMLAGTGAGLFFSAVLAMTFLCGCGLAFVHLLRLILRPFFSQRYSRLLATFCLSAWATAAFTGLGLSLFRLDEALFLFGHRNMLSLRLLLLLPRWALRSAGLPVSPDSLGDIIRESRGDFERAGEYRRACLTQSAVLDPATRMKFLPRLLRTTDHDWFINAV